MCCKGDCKPFWGLSPRICSTGWDVHPHGSGERGREGFVCPRGGEQDLQCVPSVSGCPRCRSLLPGAWLRGCVRHVACQHCYNSRGIMGFVSSEHVQMPNLFIPLTLPFASFRGICIETQRMERGKRGDGDRKRASPGSARRGDKHLCVAGDSSWIHPVVLASERSPQENKCFVFQDPPQLKIFLETSFLWETKPRCTAGLCRWCLYGWGSLSWGLRFQLQGEPNLRKAQNI